MTDINSSADAKRTTLEGNTGKSGAPSTAEQDRLLGLVELLFFAYRDFTGEADTVLEQFGFGRAHHRVLHFVSRRPGLRVADLLDILRITKQSLARVLKELVDRGFIAQEAGSHDRRERRLFVTSTGRALALKLAGLQTARVREAVAAACATAVGVENDVEALTRAFLLGMISPDGRSAIISAIEQAGNAAEAISASTAGRSTQSGDASATSPPARGGISGKGPRRRTRHDHAST